MKKNNYPLLNTLFGLFLVLLYCSATAGDGRVILQNLPDSTEISVNGLSRLPDSSGVITVSPGPILLEIKRQKVVVYSTLFMIDSSEEKTIPLECVNNCGLLHVMTEPTGATLSMNGAILGTTPYLNRFLKPGSYSIMATYPGYVPIIRRVVLSADSSQVFSYQMEMSLAMKDSIASVKRALHHKRQIIQSTLCGAAGIAMVAAGAWFDWKAVGFLDKAEENAKAYNAAVNSNDCQQAKKAYYSNRDNARRPILYRNILYGAAGVCLIGFYVSFVF